MCQVLSNTFLFFNEDCDEEFQDPYDLQLYNLLSNPSRIIKMVVTSLDMLVSHNPLSHFNIQLASFYNKRLPPISLDDYANRLLLYTTDFVSPVCLLAAFLLIEKLSKKFSFLVTEYTVFRLLLVGFLISHKVIDDAPHIDHKTYSLISGVSVAEINNMEIAMLRALDWDLSFDTIYFRNRVLEMKND
jgi:hypothetical protein